MKVLIVDDLALMRGVISHLVTELGCSSHMVAENGQKALSILEKENFDAILTDMNMPIMNGIDLVTAIRNNPKLQHTPVLMISAENHKNQVLAAAKAGADGYIVKPFNKTMLESKINYAIERRNTIRQRIHTTAK